MTFCYSLKTVTELCPEFLETDRNGCTSVHWLIIRRWLQPVANDCNCQQVTLISPNFETAFCGLIILWLEVRILQGPPHVLEPLPSMTYPPLVNCWNTRAGTPGWLNNIPSVFAAILLLAAPCFVSTILSSYATRIIFARSQSMLARS